MSISFWEETWFGTAGDRCVLKIRFKPTTLSQGWRAQSKLIRDLGRHPCFCDLSFPVLSCPFPSYLSYLSHLCNLSHLSHLCNLSYLCRLCNLPYLCCLSYLSYLILSLSYLVLSDPSFLIQLVTYLSYLMYLPTHLSTVSRLNAGPRQKQLLHQIIRTNSQRQGKELTDPKGASTELVKEVAKSPAS
jgi:hypothetical protein